MSGSYALEKYHRPKKMDEAIGILSKYENKVQIIAGGTDILSLKQDSKQISHASHLMDISQLGLNYIKKKKDSICIGAATDINSIAYSPSVVSLLKVLSEAALSHSTYTIRNRATIGGNLCNASPCADLSLPLLALDASLVVAGNKGEENIQLANFFKGVNFTALAPTQILKEIIIPLKPATTSASFFKLRRHQTAIDIAIVNVATLLSFEENHCLTARIALGSVGPIPFRAKNAEALLYDKELNKKIIQQAAKIAATESTPIDDNRATLFYRKKMVAVLVENSLEESIQRSRHEKN